LNGSTQKVFVRHVKNYVPRALKICIYRYYHQHPKLFKQELRGVGVAPIWEGVCWVWIDEKNQPRIGANPASLWLAPRIGFANPHLNTAGISQVYRLAQLRSSAFSVQSAIAAPVHPSSGTFGQILSPPQRLPIISSPPLFH